MYVCSHSQEVEAGVELRLGCEVQVFRAKDGARESGVDGLEVRLLDAPFLRSRQEYASITAVQVQYDNCIMMERRCCAFLGVFNFCMSAPDNSGISHIAYSSSMAVGTTEHGTKATRWQR